MQLHFEADDGSVADGGAQQHHNIYERCASGTLHGRYDWSSGPVCARVCQTAYGIHDSTWADMLASARNGTLSAESLVQEEHGLLALLDADEESFSNSKEVTIDWWKLWLTLEDQMPNEPVIQHRILMWMDVWKVEYCSELSGVDANSRAADGES